MLHFILTLPVYYDVGLARLGRTRGDSDRTSRHRDTIPFAAVLFPISLLQANKQAMQV